MKYKIRRREREKQRKKGAVCNIKPLFQCDSKTHKKKVDLRSKEKKADRKIVKAFEITTNVEPAFVNLRANFMVES